MTSDHATQERCWAPSARRYPHCGCAACRAAHTAYKRAQRLANSAGAYECPFCGHRSETLNGLRIHKGHRHKQMVVAW